MARPFDPTIPSAFFFRGERDWNNRQAGRLRRVDNAILGDTRRAFRSIGREHDVRPTARCANQVAKRTRCAASGRTARGVDAVTRERGSDELSVAAPGYEHANRTPV